MEVAPAAEAVQETANGAGSDNGAQLARELAAAQYPVAVERVNKAVERPIQKGFEKILETLFIEDPWATFQDLEQKLALFDRRTDPGSTLEALDLAETNARSAHRLFCTAKVAHREWELENALVFSAMYAEATASLQQEKDSKARNKAITDADVTHRAVVLFPDEYKAQEVRKTKVEMMVKSMENLADMWKSRVFTLRAIQEAQR